MQAFIICLITIVKVCSISCCVLIILYRLTKICSDSTKQPLNNKSKSIAQGYFAASDHMFINRIVPLCQNKGFSTQPSFQCKYFIVKRRRTNGLFCSLYPVISCYPVISSYINCEVRRLLEGGAN